MTSHVRLTDDRAQALHPHHPEPRPGSVVLTDGPCGNAYQLYASDGLWHRGKAAVTWDWLLTQRNLVLVHSAPSQPEVESRGWSTAMLGDKAVSR